VKIYDRTSEQQTLRVVKKLLARAHALARKVVLANGPAAARLRGITITIGLAMDDVGTVLERDSAKATVKLTAKNRKGAERKDGA